jgi:sterol desaturase/sphingolipid hydroxylase (fatty acid hydroxylase superfamily)
MFLILPVPGLAAFVWGLHQIFRNAIGHSGYEIFPANRDGRPMFDWMTTVTHHDLHHARAGWNFGLYFTWWDRWMGTEHPDYHAEFARTVARTARARPQPGR